MSSKTQEEKTGQELSLWEMIHASGFLKGKETTTETGNEKINEDKEETFFMTREKFRPT